MFLSACSIKPHPPTAFLSCGLPRSKSRNGTSQGLSSPFRTDRFFLVTSICQGLFAFAGAECLFSGMMDRTFHQCPPIWLSCHIFPHSYVDNLSRYTTTIIQYFLCNRASLVNYQYFVNSSRTLNWLQTLTFLPTLSRLLATSHLIVKGFFFFLFPPMKWFCDYPLERSAKCQFNTWNELQTFYLLHFSR